MPERHLSATPSAEVLARFPEQITLDVTDEIVKLSECGSEGKCVISLAGKARFPGYKVLTKYHRVTAKGRRPASMAVTHKTPGGWACRYLLDVELELAVMRFDVEGGKGMPPGARVLHRDGLPYRKKTPSRSRLAGVVRARKAREAGGSPDKKYTYRQEVAMATASLRGKAQ